MNFYVMTAANLYVGDHDPANSKHLTLAEMKLPDLQEIYADHHPGGATMGVEVGLGIQKLEPTFKLNGWDPRLLAEFGLGGGRRQRYTAYGVVVDKGKGGGTKHETKAIFEARLGKVAPDAFQRGELQGHEYALNEVFHYELWFNGKEIYYFDFLTNVWRVNGNDENAEANRILRIGG